MQKEYCRHCKQSIDQRSLDLWSEIDRWRDPALKITEERQSFHCLPECSEHNTLDHWFPPMQWLNEYAMSWIQAELHQRVIERGNRPASWLIADVRSERNRPHPIDEWEEISFWLRIQDITNWYWDVDCGDFDTDDEYYSALLNRPKPEDFGNHARRCAQGIWNDYRLQKLYDIQLEAESKEFDDE